MHECQCQNHDCTNVVCCSRPFVCGKRDAFEHLCNACQDGRCGDGPSVVLNDDATTSYNGPDW